MAEIETLPGSFTSTVSVEAHPEDVFAAIVNVRGWWCEDIDGPTDQVGNEFTYHHHDVHRCIIRVIEIVRPSRVIWQVIDNCFHFTDAEIRFDIVPTAQGTDLRFTHVGLIPAYECFDRCSNSSEDSLVTSLLGLDRMGKVLSDPVEPPAH